MEFSSYLKLNAQAIEEELEKILAEFLKQTKKTSPKLLPFTKAFVNSCKGGKRIRGVLSKLGYELAGGESREIFKVGAALEILHTAILVHDDIIDQSPTRRGKLSLYQALGGNHYGQSQAIVLGDIGLYLPIKIIADSNFPGEYIIKALSYLSAVIVNTGLGQVLDVTAEKDLMLLYKLKTAHYTICGPLILGAILAGAKERMIGALWEFGENLGIVYQIKDDILDGESKPLSERLTDYASQAKKMIPKITKDKKMRVLL